MNKEQTVDICKRVFTVEGRTDTAEIDKAWHDLLQGLDVEVANKACSLALQDHNIHMVTPKHILAKVPAAVAELNALLKSAGGEESEWRSELEPICRHHNLPILQCADCCSLLVTDAGHLHGDRLHSWAIAHVYRADSLVGEGAPF